MVCPGVVGVYAGEHAGVHAGVHAEVHAGVHTGMRAGMHAAVDPRDPAPRKSLPAAYLHASHTEIVSGGLLACKYCRRGRFSPLEATVGGCHSPADRPAAAVSDPC